MATSSTDIACGSYDPIRRAMLLVTGDKSTGILPGSPTDREGE